MHSALICILSFGGFIILINISSARKFFALTFGYNDPNAVKSEFKAAAERFRFKICFFTISSRSYACYAGPPRRSVRIKSNTYCGFGCVGDYYEGFVNIYVFIPYPTIYFRYLRFYGTEKTNKIKINRVLRYAGRLIVVKIIVSFS